MCGRFAQTTNVQRVREMTELFGDFPLANSYNIAPTSNIAAILRLPDGSKQWTTLRWGLIPFWAKDKAIGNRMINAKAETLTQKPSFRNAVKKRRCLIPADGFYEWVTRDGAKQPYYIKYRDDRPLLFAGLWEHWQHEEEHIDSATIITTAANATLKPIHERMPALIQESDIELWLSPEPLEGKILGRLLASPPADDLITYPVSTWVNNPRHDSPQCIQPQTP